MGACATHAQDEHAHGNNAGALTTVNLAVDGEQFGKLLLLGDFGLPHFLLVPV